MNLFDILILLAVTAAILLAALQIRRGRKTGRDCCGNCGSCTGCPLYREKPDHPVP